MTKPIQMCECCEEQPATHTLYVEDGATRKFIPMASCFECNPERDGEDLRENGFQAEACARVRGPEFEGYYERLQHNLELGADCARPYSDDDYLP